MRVLSCFEGCGMHSLGLEWAGMEIVGQIENNQWLQKKVLKKHWPKVKKWGDIRNVSIESIRRHCGNIDLVTGGFPCTDVSTAGKGKGITHGEASYLWRELWRIIRGIKPRWILLENVPALRVRGADGILAALEAIGYTLETVVVGAWAVGAPHKRDRVFIIGWMGNTSITGCQSGGVRSRNETQISSAANSSDSTCEGNNNLGQLGNSSSERERESTEKANPQPASGRSWNEFVCSSELEHTEKSRIRTVAERSNGQDLADFDGAGQDVSDANRHPIWHQSRWRIGASGQEASFAFPLGPGPEQYEWERRRLVGVKRKS